MKYVKELLPYVLIILAVVLIRTFIVTPVRVNGKSMDPTLENNEIVLLKKYDKSFDRFDIVVFDYEDSHLIKRIVGLPGETLYYYKNDLYINDKKVKEDFLPKGTETYDFVWDAKIPEDYYFVMGDNRENSTDSRVIGLVAKEDIRGTTNFVLFPFNRFGNIKSA